MMRRFVTVFALLIFMVLPFLWFSQVHAQLNPLDEVCEGVTDAAVCSTDGSDPIAGSDGVILNVVEILSWVVGLASVIMVVLGGLKFITAQGDSNSIASARNTIIYALIGGAVFLASQLIVRFVISSV